MLLFFALLHPLKDLYDNQLSGYYIYLGNTYLYLYAILFIFSINQKKITHRRRLRRIIERNELLREA